MVGGSDGYARWFPFAYEITREKSKANVCWWEGGADIAPWLYKEKVGSYTSYYERSSKEELAAWEYFKDKNVLKIGTCKGLQNLTVFNGGHMVQHVSHPHSHELITNDGLIIRSNSLHHQQTIVDEKYTGLKAGVDYELMAWTPKLSNVHLNGDDVDYNFPADYKEPEMTWFPKTKSWGVQGHPEMAPPNSDFVKYCQKRLVEKMKESKFI